MTTDFDAFVSAYRSTLPPDPHNWEHPHKWRPQCPVCGELGRLLRGHHLGLKGVSGSRLYYACLDHDTRVSVHPDRSNRSKGTMAGPKLRKLRCDVHAVLDPLWKHGGMSRADAYEALSMLMGIPRKKCHVGEFNEEQCRLALLLLSDKETRMK
jgi:hypothetical protein